jgi:hypothetical protein
MCPKAMSGFPGKGSYAACILEAPFGVIQRKCLTRLLAKTSGDLMAYKTHTRKGCTFYFRGTGS